MGLKKIIEHHVDFQFESFESAGYSAAEMDQNAKEIEDLTGY